jgi:hypothetical protein
MLAPAVLRIAGIVSAFAAASTVLAQTIREQTLDIDSTTPPAVIDSRISGDEIVDFVVSGEQSQILSVDMQTSNAAAYFNVLPVGSETALFIGSTSGAVVDLPLPASGAYAIRVYLMRSAARRNESADFSLTVDISGPDFADGLAGGPDFWVVAGVGSGDALNIRNGPSMRYAVTGKLRNGNVLENRGCRLSGDMRWCNVRAVGSGVTGWVAGRYLRESPPPPRPQMPAGGPVGNGTPFDATGTVDCQSTSAEPTERCLFGVIRQGPGNAGVWIAIGDGAERYFLFESGMPVSSNTADELSFDKIGDLYRIRVGAERYEIPEAVVYGG